MNQVQPTVSPESPMDKPEPSKDLLRVAFIAVGSFFIASGLICFLSNCYSLAIFQGSFNDDFTSKILYSIALLMITGFVTFVIGCLILLLGFGKIGKSSSNPLKIGMLIIGFYLIYYGAYLAVQYLIFMQGHALDTNLGTLTLTATVLAYLIPGIVMSLASLGKINPSFRH